MAERSPGFMQYRGLLRLAAAAAVGLLLAGLLLAVAGYRYLHAPLPVSAPVTITVEAGTALNGVARNLAEQQHLDRPGFFVLWARLQGSGQRIHAGEYRLEPQTTPLALLDKLVSGDTVQYPVTFIEGWTFNRALETLWQEESIENTLEPLSREAIAERIDSPFPALEGSLFPDTYFYTRGTSDAEILRRASRRMQQVLQRHWAERAEDLPYDAPWQALTMASLIEKESGHEAEKTRIAGVFVRRLRRGMRLQSDPTVIYGMGVDYDGVIRRSDLREQTAYNTYRIDGLPPTPIALSGEDSIHASLNPEPGPYLYFVSRGDGSHHFSTTLEEHNEAIARYLRDTEDTGQQE